MVDATLEGAARVLVSLKRQGGEIAKVREQVQDDDKARAEQQAQRQRAPRVLHFAGDIGDIVPGIRREQCADHRSGHNKHHGQAGDGNHVHDPDECLGLIYSRPQIRLVALDSFGASRHGETGQDQ